MGSVCVKEGVYSGISVCSTVCHLRAVCVKEGVFNGISLCEGGGI